METEAAYNCDEAWRERQCAKSYKLSLTDFDCGKHYIKVCCSLRLRRDHNTDASRASRYLGKFLALKLQTFTYGFQSMQKIL